MRVSELGAVSSMNVDDIVPYQRNPRKIPEKAVKIVAESLRKFGWQQPLVVDRAHVLIVGHTRLQAAISIGEKTVPVVVAENLSDEQIRAYRIADNRTHDFTSWDLPDLVAELDGIGSDFADVIALDDWQTMIDKFDAPPPTPEPETSEVTVVVVFADRPSADAAQEGLIELDGVTDVRYK